MSAPEWSGEGVSRATLRRAWHPVVRSVDLGSEPRRVTLCDEHVVVARLEGGVAAFADVCVHRGTALSLGTVEGGCLVCPYHGWAYGDDGACVRVPALGPDGRVPARAQLRTHHAEERFGLVWVCLDAPAFALPDFGELEEPGLRVVVGEPYEWAVSPTRRIENFLDFAHFAFVHDGVLGRRDRPEVPEHTVSRVGGELRIHQDRHEPDNDGVKPGATDGDTFESSVDYRVFVPLAATLDQRMPGGERFVLSIASSPVGERRSHTFWILARNYGLDEGDDRYIAFQKTVNEQDRAIIESQRPEFVPIDLSEELHVKGLDRVAVTYRRWLAELDEAVRP
jgi:vanillate O-demethylase monooxygenase subunit